jgi:hypothetical protein
MRVEYRAHAPQRVVGDGGNLRLGASGNGESRHRCCAQVMKRDVNYPRSNRHRGVGGLATRASSGAAPAAAGRCGYRERNDARDCQVTRPPTEAASEASYQTYRDARAIRITTTTANKVICAHRLLAKLWLLLSLCIAMVMSSFRDTIFNGGIQKHAPVAGKGH